MARVDNNPNRNETAKKYPKVVIGIVTHLPHQNGYHKSRMEVIRTCLTSIRKNAMMDIGVMVWDNGSCEELREWLRESYKPDWLMLSPNIGKGTARCSMYRMLPFETIFGFSDDDMLYYKNWLIPQIELLEHFPNVGVVSGYPVRSQFHWGCKNTIKWAEENGKVTRGKLISEEWDHDFCVSVGRTMDLHQKVTGNTLDVMVEYNDRKAYCTAHHCQFIGYAGILERFIQFDGMAMGDEKPFDNAVDEQGLLRLTTTERYARHIGNVLDKKTKLEAKKMGVWADGK